MEGQVYSRPLFSNNFPHFELYGCTSWTSFVPLKTGRPSFAHWKIEPSRLKMFNSPLRSSFSANALERYPMEQYTTIDWFVDSRCRLARATSVRLVAPRRWLTANS